MMLSDLFCLYLTVCLFLNILTTLHMIKHLCLFLLHAIFLFLLIYPHLEIAKNPNYVKYLDETKKGIPTIFFYTYNCLYISTAISIICIIYEIFNAITLDKQNKTLQQLDDRYQSGRIKEFLKKTIQIANTSLHSFNSVLVLIFWPLYFIKPSLVKPKATLIAKFATPIFTEICEHLVPFTYTFILLIIYKAKYNYRFITFAFGIYCYLIFSLCNAFYNRYPYAFLKDQPMLICFALSLLADLIGLSSKTIFKERNTKITQRYILIR